MLLLFSLLTVATDNSCFNLRITIGGLVLVRFARDHPQGSSPSPAQCVAVYQCRPNVDADEAMMVQHADVGGTHEQEATATTNTLLANLLIR